MTSDAHDFAALFLAHQPHAIAIMQSENTYRTTGKKYHEFSRPPTEKELLEHLAGSHTIAIPYAHGGLGRILPLDIDHGGAPVIEGLISESNRRGLWTFGVYDPDRRTGYVIMPFDELVNAERLQILGHEMALAVAAQIAQGEASMARGAIVAEGIGGKVKIEVRAHESVTRIPMGRHRWTGKYGHLLLPEDSTPPGIRHVDIDANHAVALHMLIANWQNNPIANLPDLPHETPRSVRNPPITSTQGGISIDSFNRDNDLLDILGGRITLLMRGQARCHCGNHSHGDEHPSLKILEPRNPRYGRHILMGFASGCLFSTERGEFVTAFEAYRRLNGHTSAEDALRALNGIEDRPKGNQRSGGGQGEGGDKTPDAQQTRRQESHERGWTGEEKELQKYIKSSKCSAGVLIYAIARKRLGRPSTQAEINAVIGRLRGRRYDERHLRRLAAEYSEIVAQWNAENGPSGGGAFCPLPNAMSGTEHVTQGHVGGGSPPASDASHLWESELVADDLAVGPELVADDLAVGPEPMADDLAVGPEPVAYPGGACYDPQHDLFAGGVSWPETAVPITLEVEPLSVELQAALAQLTQAAAPPMYGPPADPERRRKYFSLLGAARKAKSLGQRRRLQTLAAAMEEPQPLQVVVPPPLIALLDAAPAAVGTPENQGQSRGGEDLPPPTCRSSSVLSADDPWCQLMAFQARCAEERGDHQRAEFLRFSAGLSTQSATVTISDCATPMAEQQAQLIAGNIFVDAGAHSLLEIGLSECGTQPVHSFALDSQLLTRIADGVLQIAGECGAIEPQPVSPAGNGVDAGAQLGAKLSLCGQSDQARSATLGIGGAHDNFTGNPIQIGFAQPSDLLVAKAGGADESCHSGQFFPTGVCALDVGDDFDSLFRAVAAARRTLAQSLVKLCWNQFFGLDSVPSNGVQRVAQLSPAGQLIADSGVAEAIRDHQPLQQLDMLRLQIFQEPQASFSRQGAVDAPQAFDDSLPMRAGAGVAVDLSFGGAGSLGGMPALAEVCDAVEGPRYLLDETGALAHGNPGWNVWRGRGPPGIRECGGWGQIQLSAVSAPARRGLWLPPSRGAFPFLMRWKGSVDSSDQCWGAQDSRPASRARRPGGRFARNRLSDGARGSTIRLYGLMRSSQFLFYSSRGLGPSRPVRAFRPCWRRRIVQVALGQKLRASEKLFWEGELLLIGDLGENCPMSGLGSADGQFRQVPPYIAFAVIVVIVSGG